MNKKILVSALAAAGLATAPMMASATDVRIYGHIGMNIAQINDDSPAAEADNRDSRLVAEDPARGRVGIRVSEDLGNGLQGVGQFEWMARPHDGTAFEQMRETYVGLQGGFGRIALGQFNGAYKQTGGTGWDPFVTTHLEQRRSTAGGGAYAHNSFMRNAVEYRTADLGGLRAIAQVQLVGDEDRVDVNEQAHGSYNLSLSYSIGGIELIAAHAYSNAADESNTKFGARWAEGPLAVWATFEQLDIADQAGGVGGAANAVTGDAVNVGVTYRMGNNELYAHYGMFDADQDGRDVDAITLGVTHRMSRSFRVYGGVKLEDRDVMDDRTIMMVGMRKDF
ncbi:porin [Ectothiorhodospiraceae bacterium 2226]|nr:porin [Ectothiorhodospiraceae bacterium 2226]